MLSALVLAVAISLFQPLSGGFARAAPKYQVLHNFTGGTDGGALYGSLTLDENGNLYGTTNRHGI